MATRRPFARRYDASVYMFAGINWVWMGLYPDHQLPDAKVGRNAAGATVDEEWEINDVRVFFETGKVCRCSILLLSSLIKPVCPLPGTNTLPSRFMLRVPNRTYPRHHDRGLYVPSGALKI